MPRHRGAGQHIAQIRPVGQHHCERTQLSTDTREPRADSAGRVSATAKRVRNHSTTPIPVSTQNTVRQSPNRRICAPITGARIGASPLIAAIAEK